MKLLVRNLASETSESTLSEMFEKFGRVQSCFLVLDKETGKSKGFAFIVMPKAGEAKLAIKKLNATRVDGAIIRVKKTDSKKNPAGKSPTEVVVKKDPTTEVSSTDKPTPDEPEAVINTETIKSQTSTPPKASEVNKPERSFIQKSHEPSEPEVVKPKKVRLPIRKFSLEKKEE